MFEVIESTPRNGKSRNLLYSRKIYSAVSIATNAILIIERSLSFSSYPKFSVCGKATCFRFSSRRSRGPIPFRRIACSVLSDRRITCRIIVDDNYGVPNASCSAFYRLRRTMQHLHKVNRYNRLSYSYPITISLA